MNLSIIIVNYNTRKLTHECIESVVKNSDNLSYEIILVDNASKDDSVEFFTKLEKDYRTKKINFTFIANKNNDGFSKANNIGVKKSRGEYVLFLNSDTVVPKNTLSGMVEVLENENTIGAATCFVRIPDGSLDDAAHRGFPTPLRSLMFFSGLGKVFSSSKFLNGYHLGFYDLDKTHEIEALAGAFMIVPRTVGDKVGWWDEDYYFYGEDLDFCYKIKQLGLKVLFVPEFEILHLKGMSSGIKKHSEAKSQATRETKIRVTNWRFDAMKTFYNKHYINKYPRIVSAMVMKGIELKRKNTLKSI